MLKLKKLVPRWLKAPRFFKSILVLLAILMLLIIFLPLFTYFVIADGQSGTILYKTPIEAEDQFAIKFIHSTHLTPVEEIYRVDKDLNIQLFELHFDSYGVGMESSLNEGELLELRDGKIIIKNMNRIFPYIDLRVGQVIANHTITIDNFNVELSNITSTGSQIRIQVKKLSILEILGVR